MGFNNDLIQIIIIIAVILIGAACYVFFNKKSSKKTKITITEDADLLMTVLPQALEQKVLEDPLLTSAKESPQAINRLYIAAVYLIFCLTAISRSKGDAHYINSQDFANLWSSTVSKLKQLYVKRGTNPERMNELISINLQKIKVLLKTYSQEIKLPNVDASLAVQAWFEDLSYINLANKPYLTNMLLKIFGQAGDQKFIIALCQPKAYSLLIHKVRDKTEHFIRLNHTVSNEPLSESGQLVSYTSFERYITSFLLILGITILERANTTTSYLYTSEYQAVKNKAIAMIKAMLNNSRKMGVQSIDTSHTNKIMAFMDKQLTALQMVCEKYLKTLNNIHAEKANPALFLLEWFKQTLPCNAKVSKVIENYIQSELNH